MQESPFAKTAREEMGLNQDLGEVSFEDVRDTFHRWLYIEDEHAIDVVFATIIANRLTADPVWLFYIASPGGSKTEILRAFGTSNEVYMLSSLTENTLISGFRTKPDPSLLPKLNGKILVIKDFTALLSIHREARAKIIGDLRDAYDGQCTKTFGTGDRKSYHSKFGLIAAVTPIIDKCWGIQADLGERFLRYRIRLSDQQKAIQRAMANAGKEKEMREQLSSVTQSFLSACEVPRTKEITIDSNLDNRIVLLANLLALGRSRVSRDRDGTIDYEPDPEVGTRIAKQLKLLGTGFVSIHGQNHLDENAYEFLRRICRDTLPSREAKVLEAMFLTQENGASVPTCDVGDRSGFPTETCKKVLEDFRLLKVVEREGTGTFKWRLSGRFRESSRLTGLFIPF